MFSMTDAVLQDLLSILEKNFGYRCFRGTPIEEVELAVRTYDGLRREGIRYLEEAAARSDSDLGRHMGPKSIAEIRDAIKRIWAG